MPSLSNTDGFNTGLTALGKALMPDGGEMARAAYYGAGAAKTRQDAEIEQQKWQARQRAAGRYGQGIADNTTFADSFLSGQDGADLGNTRLAFAAQQPGATPASLAPFQIGAKMSYGTTQPGQEQAEKAQAASAATVAGIGAAATRYGYDVQARSARERLGVDQAHYERMDATSRAEVDARIAAEIKKQNDLVEQNKAVAAAKVLEEDNKLVNVIDAAGNATQVTAKRLREAMPGEFEPYVNAVQAAEVKARIAAQRGTGGPGTVAAPHLAPSALKDFSALLESQVNARLGLPAADDSVRTGRLKGVDLNAIRQRAEALYQAGPTAQNTTASIAQAIDEHVGRTPAVPGQGPISRYAPTWLGGEDQTVKPGDQSPVLPTPDVVGGRTAAPGKGGAPGTAYGPPAAPGTAPNPAGSGAAAPGTAGVYGPGSKLVDPEDGSPLSQQWNIARNVQTATGVPAWQVMAVRSQESAKQDPAGRGPAGQPTIGAMQLPPGAVDTVGRVMGKTYTPQELERDPALATRVAGHYLAILNRQYGDDKLALAAYNYGPKWVNDALEASQGDANKAFLMLPSDVKEYVARAMVFKPPAPGEQPTAPYAPVAPADTPAPATAGTGTGAPATAPAPAPAPRGTVSVVPLPRPNDINVAPPVLAVPGMPGLTMNNIASGLAGALTATTTAPAPAPTPAPTQPLVTNPQGQKVDSNRVLAEAKDAILRGANREATIRRVRSMGVEPVGL